MAAVGREDPPPELRGGMMVAWHAGKSIRYLGIHINMHRDWDAHWEEVVGEIRKDMNTLRRNTISCAEAKYVIDTRVRVIL